MITTVGMETIAWYRYEGTVDTEGIGIEMERLAAREMLQTIFKIIPLPSHWPEQEFLIGECCVTSLSPVWGAASSGLTMTASVWTRTSLR